MNAGISKSSSSFVIGALGAEGTRVGMAAAIGVGVGAGALIGLGRERSGIDMVKRIRGLPRHIYKCPLFAGVRGSYFRIHPCLTFATEIG